MKKLSVNFFNLRLLFLAIFLNLLVFNSLQADPFVDSGSDAGTVAKGCDYITGKCLEGVDSSLFKCSEDKDCLKRCDGDGKCTLGGKGHFCDAKVVVDLGKAGITEDNYCASSKSCDLNSDKPKCVLGSFGASCENENDCTNKKCFNGKCVAGSDWGRSCISNSDCLEKRCTFAGACMLGGLGKTCTRNQDCNNSDKYCGYHYNRSLGWQVACTEGPSVSGVSCKKATDCPIRKCRLKGGKAQCVGIDKKSQKDGLVGAWCREDSDCSNFYCERGQCKQGNWIQGAACNPNDPNACKAKRCAPEILGKGKCVDGKSSGPSCKNDKECFHAKCLVESYGTLDEPDTYSCQYSFGPGVDVCLDENGKLDHSKCEYLNEKVKKEVQNVSEDPGVRYRLRDTSVKNNLELLDSVPVRNLIGKEEAPITLVKFQDLKCGMCKAAKNKILDPLIESYVLKGKLKIVFRELPLGFRSDESKLAAAAICAGKQSKYYEYISIIYDNMKDATPEDVVGYAKKVGLEVSKFKECFNSDTTIKQVEEDYQLSKRLSISGTPHFYLDGIELGGFQSVDNFVDLIDEKLEDGA